VRVRARVVVYPRPEILDPQGKAVLQALDRIGIREVREVRAGKVFDIELETENEERARLRLQESCDKLLANTIVEDYSVEILQSPPATTA
jgi:phosphoribosylformylglycinamidine synthase